MEKLSNPRITVEILKKYDFAFRKRFGQNFLIDGRVLDKIIAGAGVCREDLVLEIGPGIGTLTQYLAEAAGKVISVEIDKKLLPILEETLSAYDNVKVINADVMDLDLNELIREEMRISGGEDKALEHVKVVANLPYYITTPILMALLEQKLTVENITVMVQKEVANRMKASAGTKDYGALSLAVQYYAEPYLVANVPRNCFMPRPNVDSAVIRLTKRSVPPVMVKDEKLLFAVIRASFEQRRKTLVNSLAGSSRLSFTKEQIVQAIEEAGLQQQVRGEALELAEFSRLTDCLTSISDS